MIVTERISEVHNEDCMVGMARYPDKWFDLAVVDVPYGINESSRNVVSRHHSQKKYKRSDWDNEAPDSDYFTELIRVSKNQIVWGANHFISKIPYDSSCWLYWDKDRFGDFADGELAWTSFKTAVRHFKYTWDGFRKQEPCIRIHPTEKPIALYDWIYKNYLPQGGKVIDTHLGSGSNRIAANKAGNIDFTGFELDLDYFNAQEKRWKQYISQTKLFDGNGVPLISYQPQCDKGDTNTKDSQDGLLFQNLPQV